MQDRADKCDLFSKIALQIKFTDYVNSVLQNSFKLYIDILFWLFQCTFAIHQTVSYHLLFNCFQTVICIFFEFYSMYCKRVLLKLGLKKINDLFNTKTNSRISQAKLNLKQGIYFIKKKKTGKRFL